MRREIVWNGRNYSECCGFVGYEIGQYTIRPLPLCMKDEVGNNMMLYAGGKIVRDGDKIYGVQPEKINFFGPYPADAEVVEA